MPEFSNYVHMQGTSTAGPFGGTGAHVRLRYVNINTAQASAVVNIYDGKDATGTLVASIDASSASGRQMNFADSRLRNGLFVQVTGGSGNNPDVTVVYI